MHRKFGIRRYLQNVRQPHDMRKTVAARMTGIMQTDSYFSWRVYAAKWCTAAACTATNMAASLAVLDCSHLDGSTDELTSSMAE